MIGSISEFDGESKPPAKVSPLDADADQRAVGLPPAAAGAKIESIEDSTFSRSDALVSTIDDHEQIAAKLASLEKLPTDWRAEDQLAWREIRAERERAQHKLSLIHI